MKNIMHTRRAFIRDSLYLSGAVLAGGAWLMSIPPTFARSNGASWRMPDEGDPHAATWMAFGPSAKIWGRDLLPDVRENLATIARTIAAYEPVNMLVRQEDFDLTSDLCGPTVNLIVMPIDDLWMRDTGPVFVRDQAGKISGVDFNFNGWGKKQAHARDAKVARVVAGEAQAPVLNTRLVLEGGGIEVDGQGTAIITESCVLNPNRNPGVSKEQCEAELSRLLGLEKIIWLPGIRGKDITDGHTDFYARFARPGVVVAGLDLDPNSFDHPVTKRHLEILQASTDAQGRSLEVVTLPGPSIVREEFETDDFAAGYINFYLCNGAVIAPEFGDDEADGYAHDTLQELFPDREIVQLNIDAIAAGGGGIHCTTQQQPL